MPVQILSVPIVLVALAAGPDPREAIARAAELYARQQYEQALEALDAVGQRVGPKLRPAWLFGRAATLYKLGRIDDAREAWTQAASLADPRLEAACRYNLGNCDYQQALAAANDPQQAPEALERLSRAIENYRDAIRLDPALDDARANLELATRLREQLRRMQQKQQTQSGGSSQDNSSKSNDPKQQNRSQPSKQPQPSADSKQPSPDQQQDDGQGDAQRPQQQDASPQDADTSQTSPSQDQQAAQPQVPPPASQPASPPTDARGRRLRLTREQAERLLQMIRDLERQRREMLRRMQAGRQRPVDRDW